MSQAAPYEQWTHVAGVYDGVAMHLYINGEMLAEKAVTGAITQADIRGRGTILGGLAGTVDSLPQWFSGDLGEIRIWEVARTGFGYHGQLTNYHGNGTPAWIPGVFTDIDTTGG